MDNTLKAILLAAGVLITCAVISIGFYFYHSSEEVSSVAADNLNDFTNDISENKYMMYDGLDISGSDVVNFIKRTLGSYISEASPVSVTVTTNITNTYTNHAYIKNIQNFTDPRYINPIAKFTGSVIRNANDVIVSVRFTQQ